MESVKFLIKIYTECGKVKPRSESDLKEADKENRSRISKRYISGSHK